MEIFGSLIDGKIEKSNEPSSRISVITQKEWAKLHLIDEVGIKKALTVLQTSSIKETTAYEKAELLQNIARLLQRDKEKLAKIITLEMGKPIRESEIEVDYTSSYFTWFAEEAKRVYGLEIPSQFSDKRLQLRYEPIGPCAIISPWNFPLAMAGRKIAAAFAAGCPIIAKPSLDTPISLITFGLLCLEAGIPQEAMQVLVGDSKMIGEAFLNTFFIRKLSFTGSCEVGKYLFEKSGKTLKKLTMELGGNAPFIVFDDADLDKAVEGAIISKFRQSGQTCVCTNRLFIQKKIYPHFLNRLIEKVKIMKIGNPLDQKTNLSFAIHPTAQEKAKRHIADALQRGAKAHLGAKEPYEPEILTEVTDEMLIFNEETFAPIAGITTFEKTKEVIERANQTPYGLAAYVFTEGLKLAEDVCSGLDFGIIGLNDGLFSAAQIPFGGVKASGFGREGGSIGIHEYLTEKVISYKQ